MPPPRTSSTSAAASDMFELEVLDEHIPSTRTYSTFLAVRASMFDLNVRGAAHEDRVTL